MKGVVAVASLPEGVLPTSIASKACSENITSCLALCETTRSGLAATTVATPADIQCPAHPQNREPLTSTHLCECLSTCTPLARHHSHSLGQASRLVATSSRRLGKGSSISLLGGVTTLGQRLSNSGGIGGHIVVLLGHCQCLGLWWRGGGRVRHVSAAPEKSSTGVC